MLNIVVCVKQAPDTAGEVKTNSGLLADAVGLTAQYRKIVAEQSVFGVVGDLFQVVPQLLEEIGKPAGS